MPFIEPKNRDRINLLGCEASDNVGDICYVFYRHMVSMWNDEPRWRTAHRAFRQFSEEPENTDFFEYVYDKLMHKFELADVVCAAKLAYIEFYRNIVSKYEDKKREENGDIFG